MALTFPTFRQRRSKTSPVAVCTLLLAIVVSGPATSSQIETSFEMVTVLPRGLPPAVNLQLPLADVKLGQFMFGSTLLSGDNSTACASCHVATSGLSGATEHAVGTGGFRTQRRAPPLFNLYLDATLMWDGSAPTLADQIPMPLESPEMAIDWPLTIKRLDHSSEATALREAAGISAFTRQTVILALSSFASSLVVGDSRFDRYYYAYQASALSASEIRGLRLFVRKAQCGGCHLLDGRSAPMTDGSFHATGVGFQNGKYADRGRYEVTKNVVNDGQFKTPSLRNVGLRPFLMHDGSMTTIEQVINFYNRGGVEGAANLDGRITKLFLSQAETADLAAFLRSLTSEVKIYVRAAP